LRRVKFGGRQRRTMARHPKEVPMERPGMASDAWRAACEPIPFEREDFEVLDLALCLVPDLRICALALKQARRRQLAYPVKSVEDLIAHLDDGRLVAGRHVIDADEIRTYLHAGLFPLAHEGALLSAVYSGLCRQRLEQAAASAVHRKTLERVALLPPGGGAG
jgi:hypothetical protein